MVRCPYTCRKTSILMSIAHCLFRSATYRLGMLIMVSGIALSVSAEPGRAPLILDTQSGIHDGQSGTVLQNAPLSRAPIAAPAQMAAPAELAPNSGMPVIVAPYIEIPAWNPQQPRQSRQ